MANRGGMASAAPATEVVLAVTVPGTLRLPAAA